jgi:MATE family multidrug resistance protein
MIASADLVHPRRAEAGKLLRLAGPLILGQLAGVLMTFVDTVMAGRLSAEALASVAAGAALWHTIMLAGLGTLLAVSASVAQLDGAGKHGAIGPLVRQALWIAGGLTVVTVALAFCAGPLIEALEIAPSLHSTILGYLRALLWGAPAMYAFLALRFLCEGMEISRPVMYFGFIGLGVNVVANYGLIYGHWGLPALGAIGCGYATSAVWWTQLMGLVVYIRRHPRLASLDVFNHLERPRLRPISELLRVGVPIGFSLFVEVSMFAGVALLMGSISAVAVAAHQIAINVASTTFMVPLGISLATTVRVGNAAGRGDLEAVRRSGWLGIQLALAAQVLSAVFLVTLPGPIARIYSADQGVITIAIQLLLLAAVFQLSDGLQVSAAGALRGLKDTRGPMIVTVVAYWLLGLPFGYWLCFQRDLGPRGLWIGIIGGLTVAGVLLAARFRGLARSKERPTRNA